MTTFTGTNTEKIDQLITAVVELRTTVRLCLAAVGLGVPVLLGLTVFLVTKAFDHAARLERLEDRLGRVEKTLTAVEERLGRMEKSLATLEHRLRKLDPPRE
jgi:hypothetical protein